MMWITINNNRFAIRIGVVYAPQEGKTSALNLKKMYKKITEQIKYGKEKGQNIIIVGDLNCKIGKNVKNNTECITKGGKILLDMAIKNHLQIMNSSSLCNGTWTRETNNSKSVLDYILIEKNNETIVQRMTIDEDKVLSPFNNNKTRVIYSDHNAITININWKLQFMKGPQTHLAINEKTKQNFKKNTEKAGLTKIWETSNIKPEEKYNLWSNKVMTIARETFEKKKKSKKEQPEIRTLRNQKKKLKKDIPKASLDEKRIIFERMKLINEYIVDLAKESNRNKINRIAQSIKSEKGFSGGTFWEFRKRSCVKKNDIIQVVKDENGVLCENPKEILDVHKNHYQKLLTRREMENTTGKEIETLVNKYIEILKENATNKGIKPFSAEEFYEVKKTLKNGKAADMTWWKYEYIKCAGQDLEQSFLHMINELAQSHTIPKAWTDMKIKSISKGKGDLQSMNSQRGIFLTAILSKIMEKMIKNRKKMTTISPFQCGGIKNRGICDNLFILNCAIQECRNRNEDLFLLLADLEKCFDLLWLEDSIREWVCTGMPVSEAMYIYSMNNKVSATVKTPLGESEKIELNGIVRQGTVSAVDLCAVSTDKINRLEHFEEPTKVCNVDISNPVFVDDLMSLGNLEKIENIQPMLQHLEETKKFTFNNEKGKTEIMKFELNNSLTDVKMPKIKVKKGDIGYTRNYKCLGDMYDHTGKNLSKIQKKMEKKEFIAAEVKRLGGFTMVGDADTAVRMFLIETVVKPTVLYNTETWVHIDEKEVNEINRGQYFLLRKIFEQKEKTPYHGILIEIGHWPFSYVIVYKRLMFFHHLIHSDEERISRKILINQIQSQDKNVTWWMTVRQWLNKLQLQREVTEVITIPKSSWKKMVKEKLNKFVGELLLQQNKNKTKGRFQLDFAKKEYLQLPMNEVKNIMKIRLNMVEVKANFKGKYKDTICPACKKENETTEHVIKCSEYKKLTLHSLNTDQPAEKLYNDTNWLRKASKVYQTIEMTRQFLI